MKDIKTKPKGRMPRVLERVARIPKTAMKNVWLKSKQKTASELKDAFMPNQSEESSNVPANRAGEQILEGAKSTVQKATDVTFKGGKILAQTTVRKIKEKKELSRIVQDIKNTGSQTGKPVERTASAPGKIKTQKTTATSIKRKPRAAVKTANRSVQSVKQGTKGIKTAQSAAKRTRQVKRAQKAAIRTARRAQQAARAAVQTARAAAHAVVVAVKATIAAIKGIVVAIAAGGWVAVVIILLICLIALLVGSVFGIFFGSESTGSGTSVTQAVALLNDEYHNHMQEITDNTPHDRQEITSNDGVLSICWEDVLAVFSSKVTGAEDGSQVASLDDAQLDVLRNIMWDMNGIRHSTHTESSEVEVTEVDEDGNQTTSTKTVTETILVIEITHRTPEEMARQYSFNARQNEYLALISAPENMSLWAELLGSFVSGGGEIMDPNTDWEGTGIFQWPLPQSYTITSYFGYRKDPFTGETAYHSGTDIGAPGGTPILAAADGTVTIANSIDSWGGGYGYHIKVNHTESLDTLYAHCSSLCVVIGQQVRQGEVIGYVGTTGNSTGNHLHFEVRQNGSRVDPLSFFRPKT